MRKMFLFMMMSLDGFMEGPDHDLSWHHVDEEFNTFAAEQMDEADTIIMGRRTYQLMESFWPSKEGLEGDPEVAQRMNNTPKIVYSKTLQEVNETENWKHVTVLHEVDAEQLTKLKEQGGKDIIVLGSNNLCVTLLEKQMLDEIRIMVNPVVIGQGTKLFEGLKEPEKFKLIKSRQFKNGNVLVTYHPVR